MNELREDTMTITVYGRAFSTYTCTVLMTLIEKGVPFALDEDGLDPLSGLRRQPHIDRHPFGKMPAIKDGSFLLYETSAICRYIDEKFEGPNLVPDDLRDRAHTEQWISAINSYVDENFIRQFVLQYAFPRGADGQPDRAAIDRATPKIQHNLRILDGGIGKSGYLVGDRLSLADLFLAPILYYLGQTPEGPGLLQEAPNVKHGLETISKRASFAQTLGNV